MPKINKKKAKEFEIGLKKAFGRSSAAEEEELKRLRRERQLRKIKKSR